MRRQIILILFLVLVMLDRPALGQELEATVTLDFAQSNRYTLAVLNSSPGESIDSVAVTLGGVHKFDTGRTRSVFSVQPGLGLVDYRKPHPARYHVLCN